MLRPLDLQTLYMNLDKVGKEQAQSKEAVLQAQTHQVQKMAKEHDQGQRSVRRPQPAGETGAETKVADEGPPNGHQPPPRRRSEAGETPEEPPVDEAWKDPQLGRHIDLSG